MNILKPLFTEIEENNCINHTMCLLFECWKSRSFQREIAAFKFSSMEFTPAGHCFIIHLPGGGQCPLVRDSEPIKLLEIPTSPSLYMLIFVSILVGRCWLPGITIRAIRARQPELYFDYICFDRHMRRLHLTEKGREDKEISKLQTVMKTYKRTEIIL